MSIVLMSKTHYIAVIVYIFKLNLKIKVPKWLHSPVFQNNTSINTTTFGKFLDFMDTTVKYVM